METPQRVVMRYGANCREAGLVFCFLAGEKREYAGVDFDAKALFFSIPVRDECVEQAVGGS